MSELKRQFGQKEQDPFYDTNQFDIINIDIVGKSATVKAKEFATLYVPNSEATIKWNVDERLDLPTNITLPTIYDSTRFRTGEVSEQEVFGLMVQSPCTQALNYSELTIDSYDADTGIIKVVPKLTSTVYKLTAGTNVYVNLSNSFTLFYDKPTLSRGNTANPKIKYRGKEYTNTTDPKISSLGTIKYTFTKGNIDGVFKENTDNGTIEYQSTADSKGGIILVAAELTINETDVNGEAQKNIYTSYFSVYIVPYATYVTPSHVRTGTFGTDRTLSFADSGAKYDLNAGCIITLSISSNGTGSNHQNDFYRNITTNSADAHNINISLEGSFAIVSGVFFAFQGSKRQVIQLTLRVTTKITAPTTAKICTLTTTESNGWIAPSSKTNFYMQITGA